MATQRRSLWPREHGAYAQLGAPIAAALAVRVPSLASGFLAIAAIAAFLANEPLLVVLGHRGRRRKENDGARAARRLAVLGAVAVACGAAGLALAEPVTVEIAGLAAIPTIALVALAWRRAQHSVAGELVAAAALPAASAPIAVASGIDARLAVVVWVAWSVGYAASVLAVHRVIARGRSPATRVDRVIGLTLGAVGAALALVSHRESAVLLALPLVAISLILVIRPPPARRLRAIGVGLVVASVASVCVAIGTIA